MRYCQSKKLASSMALAMAVVVGFTAYLSGQTTGSEGAALPEDGMTRVYIVRPGDNLWDISGRFLETPFAWPRLWEENEFIVNPHLIFPGEPLLMPGGVRPRATLAARQTAPPPEASNLNNMFETEEEIAPIIAPGASLIREVEPPMGQYYYSTAYRTGFISEEELIGLGMIVDTPEEKLMLTEEDLVYINLGADSGIEVGDRFAIFRNSDEIEHPETGDDLGYMVQILGSCKIEKINEDVATARIYTAIDAIKIGDRVRPYRPSIKEIVLQRHTNETRGFIVASREEGKLLGNTNLVYIDKGTNDGISEGHVFAVYNPGYLIDDHEDFSDRELQIPEHFRGFMVVVEAGTKTSAALITAASREIEVGMRIMSVND